MRAVILDLTRLFSRRHKSADTGIDRVERGIFTAIKDDPKHRYVIRFGAFYFLLDATNAQKAISTAVDGKIKTTLFLKRLSEKSGYRKVDINGFSEYWHFGHVTHRDEFWRALKAANIKITIMVHDVIPLDHPEYMRSPDEIDSFKNRKLAQWVKNADQIFCPSQYSADRLAYHAPDFKNIKVTPLALGFTPIQSKSKIENAYLVLGTIEPRKGHEHLLKIWQKLYDEMGENSPHLWIIGARGWNNDGVFEFLDHSPLMGKTVFEFGPLDDEEMKSYFSRARAILFPTKCEGFGLPLYEAIAADKPVIANDIPAFSEHLTQSSIKNLLPISNDELWYKTIKCHSENKIKLKSELPENWQCYLELHLID